LKKYVAVKNADNHDELMLAMDIDIPDIDAAAEFNYEKRRALASIKNKIQKHSHPTVWKEMIRQKNDLPRTDALLRQATELY
jgi:hypothetical protein